MTDVLTDDSALAEPVAMPDDQTDLNPATDDQDRIETDEADDQESDDEAEDGLVDYEGSDGKTYRVPAEVKDGLMIKAEFTRKTQEMAEVRKAVAARDEAIQKTAQRQAEFANDIAQLGALNARLTPFAQVQDWPSYLRQGGASAQADYAEYQALANERDQFAHSLGQKVQQRTFDEQRETVEAIEAGRAEIAKHIKGYGPAKLDELVAFAEPLGFSPDEIRQAEADPRSIRVLHLAALGQQALTRQSTTQKLVQQQAVRPAEKVSGSAPAAKSPERMSTDEWMRFRNAQARKAR